MASNEANRIINQYGIRIAYLRKDHRFRCPNQPTWHGGVHKTSKGLLCPLCFGTGKIVSSETRLARHSSERGEVLDSVGTPRRIDHIWYFKNNMKAFHNDYIVECRWNGTFPNVKPTSIVNIYRIDDIDEYTKERTGGLEYTRAYTTKSTTFNFGPLPEWSYDDSKEVILRQMAQGIQIIE